MLLSTRTVHVPAQEERDADCSEYGHLGVPCRAQFGAAACAAGDPDDAADGVEQSVSDTIANVLHYAQENGVDVDTVLERARTHVQEEADGPGSQEYRCAGRTALARREDPTTDDREGEQP